MNITDPIADMLTRVRNANSIGKSEVEMPASNLKEEIARVLSEEGFIKGYKRVNQGPQGFIKIFLKYGAKGEKVISGIKRISKPGLRVYANKEELPRVLGGLGIAIISTSTGVITDKAAKRAGVGGEVICYVW